MSNEQRRNVLRAAGVTFDPQEDNCETGGAPVDNSHASKMEGYWDGHAPTEIAQKRDDARV